MISLPYINKDPYPLILDIPQFDQKKIAEEWKNLTYPCFKVETLSGNWLSDYSGYFSISDYGNFRLNPGLYFGKEIKDYKEKKVLIGYGAEMYSLVQPIETCVKKEIQRQEKAYKNYGDFGLGFVIAKKWLTNFFIPSSRKSNKKVDTGT